MEAPDGPPRGPGIATLPPDEYLEAMRTNYATGTTPWDSGRPNPELVRLVDAGELPGKRVLEIGCGTGTNAVELARRGYRVTAVDLVDLALAKARKKAEAAGVPVEFHLGDVTRLKLDGPFDTFVDIGVYHGIRHRDLKGFLATLGRLSRPGTRWLSLAGSPSSGGPVGPPTVTEEEFRAELEPMFRILAVREFALDLAPEFKPMFWSILMERR